MSRSKHDGVANVVAEGDALTNLEKNLEFVNSGRRGRGPGVGGWRRRAGVGRMQPFHSLIACREAM
jgi:hypothetical protein